MHALSRREFLRMACTAMSSSVLAGAVHAKPGRRPNIVLIMADDMGFSDADCYGGDVRTPNLSGLAAHGLRFTQHYSTGRCWPSRASILTGYYAQQVRRDSMQGVKVGSRPDWAPLLPELLAPQGYRCYHSGKWHIDGTPIEGGFDRSWGRHKHGCDWDRFFDSKPWSVDGMEAPVKAGEDYYSTVAIADHAVACLQTHQRECPERPFFQYIAFYSPHFPLHAMKKDIDAYRDAYLEGWDVMRRRRLARMHELGIVNCELSAHQTDTIPRWNLSAEALRERIGPGEVARAVAWENLTDKQKRFQATKMAIHAAMITRMDAEIGRVVAQLKKMGQFENTLILFASDNGASAEQIIRGDGHDPEAPMGSADSYLCLGPGWSTAANTPLKLHKHWNHEGGISSPLIAHWPRGIKAAGELRHTVSHFIDIVPTVLELAGRQPLKDDEGAPPRPGRSLVPVFVADRELDRDCLWWCHASHRALRTGDWKLVAKDYQKNAWELHDLTTDRCEMKNLASQYPDRVETMAKRWEAIAAGFRRDLTG